MCVVWIRVRIVHRAFERAFQVRSNLLVVHEVREPEAQRRTDLILQGRHELGLPVAAEGRGGLMHARQTVGQGPGARHVRGERVRGELLMPGDGVGDAKEHPGVGNKRQPDHASSDSLQRAHDAHAGLVNPRAQHGVAAVIVTELVRDHRAHLVNCQHLQQRQTQSHDALTADSHYAAPLGDPGVHVDEQVHVPRCLLASSAPDSVDHVEQPRLFRDHQLGAWRVEAIPPRKDR
jgi:hypothetical protein